MAAKLTRLIHKNNDTTAPSDRELYHLQFSLQAASPETFAYTLIIRTATVNQNEYQIFIVFEWKDSLLFCD
jgi:hypothetical protein